MWLRDVIVLSKAGAQALADSPQRLHSHSAEAPPAGQPVRQPAPPPPRTACVSPDRTHRFLSTCAGGKASNSPSGRIRDAAEEGAEHQTAFWIYWGRRVFGAGSRSSNQLKTRDSHLSSHWISAPRKLLMKDASVLWSFRPRGVGCPSGAHDPFGNGGDGHGPWAGQRGCQPP